MRRSASGMIVLFALASLGCARGDWIGETLTLVDVTGTWEGEGMLTQPPASGALRLVLRQRGAKVTGDIQGVRGGPQPIDGEVNGEVLRSPSWVRGVFSGAQRLSVAMRCTSKL